MKIENMLQRFICISILFKLPWFEIANQLRKVDILIVGDKCVFDDNANLAISSDGKKKTGNNTTSISLTSNSSCTLIVCLLLISYQIFLKIKVLLL